jgi:hypothetical protein
MFTTSTRNLKILSAIVWLSGAVVLTSKGGALLQEAMTLRPGDFWLWLAPLLGLAVGLLKIRFIFGPSCRRNLERIAQLPEPKPWQCFRTGFIIFLIAMIILGTSLSRMSHGNYPFLIGMVILDFSLATALLGSSRVFWQQRIWR